MTIGSIGMRGNLAARKIGARRAPLGWRVRNTLRWSYIQGLLQYWIARLASALGVVTLTAALRIMVRKASGEWIDYGVVSRKKVTKVGVTYLVDDWVGGANDISAMKYHGCGTDNTAEANTQTVLIAECTTALNPDSTRATGTQTKTGGDNNILHSEGTLTFDAGAAVVEHGLLSQAATGGGTLWDRSVFAAINVAAADSILFKYDLTINYEA